MEITAIERSRLSDLESTIERGQKTFVEVGMALAEIRDTRLYRQTFDTFEDYCREKWGWTDRRSRQLIASAEAVAEMQSGTIVPVLATVSFNETAILLD